MRRIISLWLPTWPTDRWRRQADLRRRHATPLVLVARRSNALVVTAVDAQAAAEGIHPGMGLSDARAMLPVLQAADADPVADQSALSALALWCGRYAPWIALDGTDGLVFDATGCAHLFGGEDAMLTDLVARLGRIGIAARAAMADTRGAAWALARFGRGGVTPAGTSREAMKPLPVAALRLEAGMINDLALLGLSCVGDLLRLPRAPLAARFGLGLLRRLDQAVGNVPEPVAAQPLPARLRVRLNFPEGITQRTDIDVALARLTARLCEMLEQQGQGARQLCLTAWRADGGIQKISIGTSAPSRDIPHLLRLFTAKLDGIEPGFGIDMMALEAPVIEPFLVQQQATQTPAAGGREPSALIDRLQERLGHRSVLRLEPLDRHNPARAEILVTPEAWHAPGVWPERAPRPIRLLLAPEPIDVGLDERNENPDWFVWRRVLHRATRVEGPERIGPEWWRPDAMRRTHDYFRIEDDSGRRYWIGRSAPATGSALALATEPDTPRTHAAHLWHMHGLFA